MWCLHFLKVYPKQGPGCAAVGGSERGAVDPRTHRKWVWKFIEAVAMLVDIVARIFVNFCMVCCHHRRGDARRRRWRGHFYLIIIILVTVDVF